MVKPFLAYRKMGLVVMLGLWMAIGEALAQKPAAQAKKLRIIVEETVIRKYPSDMYRAIGTARKGDTFTYTGLTQSGWYQIHYQGDLAYVKAEHAEPIKVAPPATAETEKTVTRQPARAPSEESTAPVLPDEKRGLPLFWIVVTAVIIALYVLHVIRTHRQQREFEEYLRHKPS